MLLAGLIFMAVMLLGAMFFTRNSMLGFPSGIAWALVGAQAYTQSVVLWDVYFLLAFSSLLGMVTFSILGAYGLREKRDTLGDESMEQGDREMLDIELEKPGYWMGKDREERDLSSEGDEFDIAGKPSRRSRKVRERADDRRQRSKR